MKILFDERGISLDEPHSLTEITSFSLSLILAATLTNTEEHTQEEKETLYDAYNDIFSNFLSMFIPDKDLRPDLTMEAITQLEDTLLAEKMKEAGLKTNA